MVSFSDKSEKVSPAAKNKSFLPLPTTLYLKTFCIFLDLAFFLHLPNRNDERQVALLKDQKEGNSCYCTKRTGQKESSL
jgi:hypothetical protein